ncbi:NARE ribosyltransferase, partial [Calyptomena viridis]|nr:NARE ribosyltransferase [Calyptomena viridis]
ESAPTMELLVLLVLLAGGPGTAIRDIPLDMAPKSFDDQYRRCQDRMLRALPELNRTETPNNPLFAQVWAKATPEWQKVRDYGLRPEEVTALRVYTMNTDVYGQFNTATREAGSSSCQYRNNFHYKVLHFLLTTAVQKVGGGCHRVYRGIQGIRFTAQLGDTVRFGQFASSSKKKNQAEKFGTDTLFEVNTCHGASIQDFSPFPSQEEVLIPPYETFKVTRITSQGEKTQIQLESHSVYSNYSCEYLRGDTPGVGTGTG